MKFTLSIVKYFFFLFLIRGFSFDGFPSVNLSSPLLVSSGSIRRQSCYRLPLAAILNKARKPRQMIDQINKPSYDPLSSCYLEMRRSSVSASCNWFASLGSTSAIQLLNYRHNSFLKNFFFFLEKPYQRRP